ncbi:MAG: DNA gyrase inhibitor YacG [Pseudohongiellaceae bacterium]
MNAKTQSVNCPSCGTEVQWIEENSYRPFCCERCKLIDFGEWATEKHSIPGPPSFPEFEESEDNLQ